MRRVATEDAIKTAGISENRPYDSYAIFFADGDFAYDIDFGGSRTTSEDKAVEIAQNLYDRVHGRPARADETRRGGTHAHRVIGNRHLRSPRRQSRACPRFPSSWGSATRRAAARPIAPGDLARLRDEDRFREANDLRAWIEVEDGKIVGHGHEGAGYVGTTTFKLGPKDLVFQGVAFETLQPDPEVRDDEVRFVQTVGGRAGFPAPRRVKGRPFMRVHSATAWTTLALTIRADGSSDDELIGASAFPRHFVYDSEGELAQKAGTVDFKTWYREAHGEHTPWATRIRSRSSRRPSPRSSASSRPAS